MKILHISNNDNDGAAGGGVTTGRELATVAD